MVTELAASKAGGAWVVLGKDLAPQFEVTTGRRRISSTELSILQRLGKDTPENEDWYKWMVFWDAPLVVPGHERLVGPGRTQDEIKRAAVSYQSDRCTVKTDGDRVSVTFNRLTLGIFSGDLQFTVYKGSNLLRQEAVASTDAKDVAFIYKAGLKGFAIANGNKVVWRDTSQMWQEQDFGGAVNQQPVNIRARNRLEISADGRGIAGCVSAAAQVLLRARERGERRLRVHAQGQRQQLFAGRDAAGTVRGIRSVGRCAGGVEPPRFDGALPGGELRAVQRAAGNHAAHGGLLLPERDREATPRSRP